MKRKQEKVLRRINVQVQDQNPLAMCKISQHPEPRRIINLKAEPYMVYLRKAGKGEELFTGTEQKEPSNTEDESDISYLTFTYTHQLVHNFQSVHVLLSGTNIRSLISGYL